MRSSGGWLRCCRDASTGDERMGVRPRRGRGRNDGLVPRRDRGDDRALRAVSSLVRPRGEPPERARSPRRRRALEVRPRAGGGDRFPLGQDDPGMVVHRAGAGPPRTFGPQGGKGVRAGGAAATPTSPPSSNSPARPDCTPCRAPRSIATTTGRSAPPAFSIRRGTWTRRIPPFRSRSSGWKGRATRRIDASARSSSSPTA